MHVTQSKVLLKSSGDFCTPEFSHPSGITLRRVAETEIEKKERHQPKVYFLTPRQNYHQKCFETINFDRLHREEYINQYISM